MIGIMTAVYKNVSNLLNDFVSPGDVYHKIHKLRLGRTISVLLDEQPISGKLLEIGTSHVIPLVLKELVPKLQVHVTEFDLSKSEKGKITFTHGENSRTCPVYRINLETTPIPVEDETFDYVLCSEVLEHMEQDPMFMMSEINRVLKPGGTLLLTTPNILSSHAITKMLRGEDPYFYMQYRKAGTLDRHNYEYSINTVSQVLKASGFSGKGWTEDTFGVPVMADITKLLSHGFEIRNVGDNIFCVAKKVGPVVDRYPSVLYLD